MEVMCVNQTLAVSMECSMWAHAMDCSLTWISLLHCKHLRGCMLSLPPHFFRIMHWSDPINMDSCQMFCMTRINKCNWKVTHSAALQCMWQCIPGLSLPPQPTYELGWACRRLHIKSDYMHETWSLKIIRRQQLFTLARQNYNNLRILNGTHR